MNYIIYGLEKTAIREPGHGSHQLIALAKWANQRDDKVKQTIPSSVDSIMTKSGRTIGTLAAEAGVNLQTVRYYQRRGLITQPPKPDAGYRRYPTAALERLRFIKRAQMLGFTLHEISQLLELADGRCADVRVLGEAKRDDVDRRIADLKRLRRALDEALMACRRGDPDAHCPLIDLLARNEATRA